MGNRSYWFVSSDGVIDRAIGSRDWCARQYLGWLGPFDKRGEALEMARRRKSLARKPQDFDTSPLPLFSDSHKQKELF